MTRQRALSPVPIFASKSWGTRGARKGGKVYDLADIARPVSLSHEQAQNSTTQNDFSPAVANGALTGLIPLRLADIPSLTSDQLEAIFPTPRRHAFLRELARLVAEKGSGDE